MTEVKEGWHSLTKSWAPASADHLSLPFCPFFALRSLLFKSMWLLTLSFSLTTLSCKCFSSQGFSTKVFAGRSSLFNTVRMRLFLKTLLYPPLRMCSTEFKNRTITHSFLLLECEGEGLKSTGKNDCRRRIQTEGLCFFLLSTLVKLFIVAVTATYCRGIVIPV